VQASNLNSVNMSGLDFFSGAMDFDDLAFLSYVKFMQEADAGLSATMDRIRDANAEKKELLKDIDRLQYALNHTKGSDEIVIFGSLEDPEDPPVGWRYDFHENEVDEQLIELGTAFEKCTRTEVKERIEQMQGKIEELNSDSSVVMIDLQRLLNKRNEASTLVSNIIAGSHQTAMSIISKFAS
jgi:hypothetical protein